MKFWLEDPTILFQSEYILELWPYEAMSMNQKLNAASRFVVLLALIGFVTFYHYLPVLLGAVFLGIIVLYWRKDKKEGFLASRPVDAQQEITSNNPLGNILMHEYKYNPKRTTTDVTEICDPEVINTAAKNFVLQENKDNLDMADTFLNPGDQYQFESSMRQFYTMPVTSIPNAQDDFLKYCYGNLESTKPLHVF
jgi:hypothetical protein